MSPYVVSESSDLLVLNFSGGSIILPKEILVEENIDLINEKDFLTRFCQGIFYPVHHSVLPILVIY